MRDYKTESHPCYPVPTGDSTPPIQRPLGIPSENAGCSNSQSQPPHRICHEQTPSEHSDDTRLEAPATVLIDSSAPIASSNSYHLASMCLAGARPLEAPMLSRAVSVCVAASLVAAVIGSSFLLEPSSIGLPNSLAAQQKSKKKKFYS